MENILTTTNTTSTESSDFVTTFLIFWVLILAFLLTRISTRLKSTQINNAVPNALNTTNRMIHALKTRTKENTMDITGTLTPMEVKEHIMIKNLPKEVFDFIGTDTLKKFKYLTLDSDGLWVWKLRPRHKDGRWERPELVLPDYKQLFQKNEWVIGDSKDMITRTSTLLAYITLKKIKEDELNKQQGDKSLAQVREYERMKQLPECLIDHLRGVDVDFGFLSVDTYGPKLWPYRAKIVYDVNIWESASGGGYCPLSPPELGTDWMRQIDFSTFIIGPEMIKAYLKNNPKHMNFGASSLPDDEPITPEQDDAIENFPDLLKASPGPELGPVDTSVKDYLSSFITDPKEKSARDIQLELIIKVLNENPSIIPKVLKFIINKSNVMEQSDEC